jgi:hypothetical protein
LKEGKESRSRKMCNHADEHNMCQVMRPTMPCVGRCQFYMEEDIIAEYEIIEEDNISYEDQSGAD